MRVGRVSQPTPMIVWILGGIVSFLILATLTISNSVVEGFYNLIDWIKRHIKS